MSLNLFVPLIGAVIAVIYKKRRIAGVSLLLAGILLSILLEAFTGFVDVGTEILFVLLHTIRFVLGYIIARSVLVIIRKKHTRDTLKILVVSVLLFVITTLYFVPMGKTVSYSVKDEEREVTIKNYDNAKTIWKYLRNSLGCSRAAAAGVLGNMFAESEYDPKIIEGNGVGHGIGQWSWDRWYGADGLENFAKEKGKEWDDIHLQLSFLRHEIMENDSMDVYYDGGFSKYKRLKTVDGEDGTAKIFFSAFEYGDYVNYEDFVSDYFESMYATRSKRLTVAKLIFQDKRRFP